MSSPCLTRLLTFMVSIVAVLQLVHLALLSQLNTTSIGGGPGPPLTERSKLFPKRSLAREIWDSKNSQEDEATKDGDTTIQELYHALSTSSIIDSSGKYKVAYNVAGPRQHSNPDKTVSARSPENKEKNNDDFLFEDEEDPAAMTYDITLVTWGDQSTSKAYLISLLEKWVGPISLTLFTNNSAKINELIEFIVQTRNCHKLVRSFVTFHIVFPLDKSERKVKYKINMNQISSNMYPKTCQQFFGVGVKPNNSRSVLYPSLPVNLVKNVGRKGVQTGHVLAIPMEMLPSTDLSSSFRQLLKNHQVNNANEDSGQRKNIIYVVPSFEIKEKAKVPENKAKLLNLVKNYEARPYGSEVCWKCQVQTGYDSWYRTTGKIDQPSTFQETSWKEPWTPFFIFPNQSPPFDERFGPGGLDTLSFLCEMNMAGYKFVVLNEPFLVKRGYLRGKAKSKPLVGRDYRSFKEFKTEVRNKYPHSKRIC